MTMFGDEQTAVARTGGDSQIGVGEVTVHRRAFTIAALDNCPV
jgi:hypothetical protein